MRPAIVVKDAVLAAIERERQRIGNHLHEKLCQSLAALAIQIGLLDRRVKAGKSIAAELEQLSSHMQDLVTQAHAVSVELRAANLANHGLHAALKKLAEDCEVPCEFSGERPVMVREPAAALALLRIAEEAVRNAVQHAAPQKIILSLTHSDQLIRLGISDDGGGFAPGAGKTPGTRLHGLELMRRQARAAGAKLKIKSVQGKGTTILCTLPEPQ